MGQCIVVATVGKPFRGRQEERERENAEIHKRSIKRQLHPSFSLVGTGQNDVLSVFLHEIGAHVKRASPC